MKYAILVASSGSTFVKEYDFFVSQGGTTQDWGRNWKIVEADSIEGARVIAIGQHGARAGLYCATCGKDRWSCVGHQSEVTS
jgi:hypothetical protein